MGPVLATNKVVGIDCIVILQSESNCINLSTKTPMILEAQSKGKLKKEKGNYVCFSFLYCFVESYTIVNLLMLPWIIAFRYDKCKLKGVSKHFLIFKVEYFLIFYLFEHLE